MFLKKSTTQQLATGISLFEGLQQKKASLNESQQILKVCAKAKFKNANTRTERSLIKLIKIQSNLI